MKNLLLSILIICISLPLIGQTFGNAIDLDGIDDYAIVPHHPSLNPGDGSWSMVFWLKAANIEQNSPIVMKRNPESPWTQYSYGIGHGDPHEPEPGKRIRVAHIGSAGTSERSGHSTTEYIDGFWHHFSIIADKSQDGIIIYVDGISVDFIQLYYFGEWPTIETTTDLLIATRTSGSKIKGVLDELSIWNKALDQTHIQQFMYDTLSPNYYNTPDSGLVAYYRFDAYEDLGIGDDGNDDFRDLSSYGNHADSEGSPALIPSGIFVGIEDKLVSDEFNMYPNPASSVVCLQSIVFSQQSSVVEIYDLNGKKLLEQQIPARPADWPAGTENIEIDVSNLKSGVYCCRLILENKNVTKKLIIKK